MVYLLIFLAEFILLFLLSRILVRFFSELLLRVTRNRNLAMRLFHFFLLPGVVVHELAHLITAETLLVRTGDLNFSLEPEEDKLVLGSVGIEKTDPIRRAVIGFAPVFVGILFISFSVFYFLSDKSPLNFPLNFILVFFIVFEVGNTMFSSKKDLEGTVFLLFVIFIIAIVCYTVGFRLPESIVSYFSSDSFIEIVKRGIWILFFPIAIDSTAILLTRVLSSRSIKQ